MEGGGDGLTELRSNDQEKQSAHRKVHYLEVNLVIWYVAMLELV